MEQHSSSGGGALVQKEEDKRKTKQQTNQNNGGSTYCACDPVQVVVCLQEHGHKASKDGRGEALHRQVQREVHKHMSLSIGLHLQRGAKKTRRCEIKQTHHQISLIHSFVARACACIQSVSKGKAKQRAP